MTKPVKPVAEIELNNNSGNQLKLSFDIDNDQASLAFSDSDEKNAKQQALQRYLNNGKGKEAIACVNSYSPGKRTTKYFRLSYRQQGKMKHIHIRGGSTISELATYRAKKLQAMIDRGAELGEIIAAAKTYNN